jgi:outer membrane protein assembly factor BamB
MFFALDKNSGEARWTYDFKQDGGQPGFHGAPLMADELIITGSDGGRAESATGYICAFEKASGKVRWKHQVKFGVSADLVRSGDRLYVVTMSDELLCLELATGKVVWSFAGAAPRDDQLSGRAPVAAGNQIIFATLSGQIHSFDAGTGKSVWMHESGSPVSGAPVIRGNDLYFATLNGRAHRLNAKTGALTASFQLEGIAGTPVIVGDSLLILHGKDAQDLWLTSLDLNLNRIKWQQKNNWCSLRPHPWRDAALIGNTRGEIVAVNLSDGAILWSVKLRGPIRGLSSADDKLYVSTQRGMIFAASAGKH